MSNLTDYYRGEAKDSEGRTLQDAWALYNDFETCHDFIQFLFPLPEPSIFNPNAPLLSEDDIKIFKADPEIRENLIHSTELFMKFLGMELSVESKYKGRKHTVLDVAVEFDSDDIEHEVTEEVFDRLFIQGKVGVKPRLVTFNFRNRNRIFGEFNHNHLRMTRMLLCLTLCGLEKVSKEIHKFLKANNTIYIQPLIPAGCWEHWDLAIEGKSVPRPEKPQGFFQGADSCTIQDLTWESAKADYDEIMEMRAAGVESDLEILEKKIQWFDSWAKKLIELSDYSWPVEGDEDLWNEREKE